MKGDALNKCLAWSELLDKGQANYTQALSPLLEAGLALKQGKLVVVQNESALQDIVNRQCRKIIQIRDKAQQLAFSLGLDVSISSRPWDALVLLQALEQKSLHHCESLQLQNLSAELFGDSKYIQRVPVLNRIFAKWSKNRHLRGELRLKVFENMIYSPYALDLGQVTKALGYVCIPGNKAAKIDSFDLKHIDYVLTSENLAPFQQLNLGKGLLIFCPGYNTGLPGLWLKNLPDNCTWIHFGDLDPDGLGIFELLCRQSGCEGRFVPNIKHLKQIKNSLPEWSGARDFHPEDYSIKCIQELAAWGKEEKLFVEQEQVLHILGLDVLD